MENEEMCDNLATLMTTSQCLHREMEKRTDSLRKAVTYLADVADKESAFTAELRDVVNKHVEDFRLMLLNLSDNHNKLSEMMKGTMVFAHENDCGVQYAPAGPVIESILDYLELTITLEDVGNGKAVVVLEERSSYND